jgi:hypothetical protein
MGIRQQTTAEQFLAAQRGLHIPRARRTCACWRLAAALVAPAGA